MKTLLGIPKNATKGPKIIIRGVLFGVQDPWEEPLDMIYRPEESPGKQGRSLSSSHAEGRSPGELCASFSFGLV